MGEVAGGLGRFSGIRMKLTSILLVVVIIPTLFIGLFNYWAAKQALTESGTTDLLNIANSVYVAADALNEQVKAGKLTKEEAQEALRTRFVGPKMADGTRDLSKSTIKVGTTGYIFAMDSKATEVMHPKIEGKNIYDVQGYVGKKIVDMKNGVLTYAWLNPGETASRNKITALKYYEPWDWIIGVGSYEDEFYGAANTMKIHLLWAILIEIVVGFFLAWSIGNRISRPILEVNDVIGKMGQGELQHRLHFTNRKDEFGHLAKNYGLAMDELAVLIQHMQEISLHVAGSANQLMSSAEQTGKATEQIVGTIQEVAVGSEKQQNSIEKSFGAVHQMALEVQRVATHAKEVSVTVGEATASTNDGNQAIQLAISQMATIRTNVDQLADMMRALNERSKEIEQIVEVITGISSQTNLLALNAAIEAARAGEHGRGFAVVADEVRKLAEQSALSAGRISSLVTTIQSETGHANQMMEEGTREVAAGMETVQGAGDAFSQIQKWMEKVAGSIEEVSTTTQAISASSEQVVGSIQSIVEVAEQTSSGTQNITAATEEQLASMDEIVSSADTLARMAEELQDQIKKFKI